MKLSELQKSLSNFYVLNFCITKTSADIIGVQQDREKLKEFYSNCNVEISERFREHLKGVREKFRIVIESYECLERLFGDDLSTPKDNFREAKTND